MKLLACLALALVASSIEGRSVGVKSQKVVKNEFIDTTVPHKETSLSEEDLELGRQLFAAKEASWKTLATEVPINTKLTENEGMFEGDIANKGLNSKTIYRFMGEVNPDEPLNANNMRNAIKSAYARWPGAVIPYTVSTQYSASAAAIAEAMDNFAKKSCIRFIPRTNQTNYIDILPDAGCYSYVGRIGGKQTLSLAEGCFSRSTILHELMHAVGFFHEQSRPDRDQYVEIFLENMEAGKASQFEKYTLNQVDYLGQPYDYSSVMHYFPTAFSKNGQQTIRPVASARAQGITIGRSNDFSDIDVKELNIIAQCANAGVSVPAATTTAPGAPAATTTRATTTTKAPAANCADKQADCARIAGQGYCNQALYVTFMAENCPRSCNKCFVTM